MLRRASAADSQFEIMEFPESLVFAFGSICSNSRLTKRANFPRFQTYRFSGLASVNDTLDRDRCGFAAADAQSCDAALEVVRLERMQQRHDQPRTGGPDGMAERAGAAIDVELFAGDAQVARGRHRHHGEGLVDLEQIDVTDTPADFFQELADSRDRRGGEPL